MSATRHVLCSSKNSPIAQLSALSPIPLALSSSLTLFPSLHSLHSPTLSLSLTLSLLFPLSLPQSLRSSSLSTRHLLHSGKQARGFVSTFEREVGRVGEIREERRRGGRDRDGLNTYQSRILHTFYNPRIISGVCKLQTLSHYTISP